MVMETVLTSVTARCAWNGGFVASTPDGQLTPSREVVARKRSSMRAVTEGPLGEQHLLYVERDLKWVDLEGQQRVFEEEPVLSALPRAASGPHKEELAQPSDYAGGWVSWRSGPGGRLGRSRGASLPGIRGTPFDAPMAIASQQGSWGTL
jgi:hypothetical protein